MVQNTFNFRFFMYFCFVIEDKVKPLLKFLDNKFESVRDGAGVAFSIPVGDMSENLKQQLFGKQKKE